MRALWTLLGLLLAAGSAAAADVRLSDPSGEAPAAWSDSLSTHVSEMQELPLPGSSNDGALDRAARAPNEAHVAAPGPDADWNAASHPQQVQWESLVEEAGDGVEWRVPYTNALARSEEPQAADGPARATEAFYTVPPGAGPGANAARGSSEPREIAPSRQLSTTSALSASGSGTDTGLDLKSFVTFALAFVAPLLLSALALLPLYRRIEARRLAEHPARDVILRAAAERPGLHVSALAREIGQHKTTTLHHVRRLAEEGFVVVERDGRALRVLLPGAPREAIRGASDRVARAVAEAPGATQSDLARTLGLTRAGAKWHLDRLVEGGNLRREEKGRAVAYFPA